MKKLSVIGAVTAALLMTMNSCDKYEEGPGVSLVPREDRVANTWVVDEAYADEEEVTEDFEVYELYLTDDGNAELEYQYEILGVSFDNETNGTWEFQDDEENIHFDFEQDDQDGTYQILRLTQNELWLREVGGEVELHLEEK